ncbi:MAG: LysM peptidoglycan-binding domain-containing protein [Aggregatilineales bacterium]
MRPQRPPQRRAAMRAGLGLSLLLLAAAALACNLTTNPPTPTMRPSTEIPIFIPSITPLPGSEAVPLPGLPIEGANPNCPPPPNWIPYTVEPGDSMGLLAQQTNSTINELAAANCLADPNQIYVGQVLYLPRPPVIGN